ncbi:MAG: O-antigen ligase family protein [Bacillota bacterium]
MFIENTADSKVITGLDKGIMFGIFLFALASLTSKGASSVGVGLTCLLWLIKIIITKDYEFTTTELDKPILIFIGGLLISGIDVLSIQFFDSIEKIILAILFYYAVTNTISDLKNVKRTAYITIFSMLVALGYGSYQILYTNLRRIKGFSFSLAYGGMLAMLMMYIIVYLIFGKNKWYIKFLLLTVGVIQFINLLYTKSRGAWLAFLGGGFSLFWVRDKKWLIGFGIILILVTMLIPQPFIERFKSSFDLENDRSNIARLKQWHASLLMYKDNFINGVGMGYFKEEFRNNYNYLKPDNRAHSHNNFFHFLATTGTIGFLAFCWLLWSLCKYLYENHKKISGQWGLFIISSLAALVVFNIQGLTEFNFGDTETIRFFWFVVALNVVVIDILGVKNRKVNEQVEE